LYRSINSCKSNSYTDKQLISTNPDMKLTQDTTRSK
jgi:hypothetical protein